MRDFWFDLASSISSEAFHMSGSTFKPNLQQAERSTPPRDACKPAQRSMVSPRHTTADAGLARVSRRPLNRGTAYRNISISNIQEFQTPATNETITPTATQ
jgi:hypothetical protein